jgi:glutamate/tyrosine decarboxylase-like PLP-dependent enzyme
LLFQSISCGALFVKRKSALEIVTEHVDYLNPAEDDPDETLNLVAKSLQTTRPRVAEGVALKLTFVNPGLYTRIRAHFDPPHRHTWRAHRRNPTTTGGH